MIRFDQEEEVLGKAYDARLARRLLAYVRPYRVLVALAVVLLLLNAASDLAGPYLFKVAIDRFIAPGQLEGLGPLALAYLGVVVGGFLARYGQNLIMQVVGQRVMYDLRMELFAHFQRLSVAFFTRTPVGRLMTRITNDVSTLQEMISSGLVAVFGDVVTLAGIMAVMLAMHWHLALVTFSVLPLLFWATAAFRPKAREAHRAVRTRLARINAYLNENILGMSVVQLFNRVQKNFARFDRLNQDYLESNLQAIRYFAIFQPVVQLISTLAVALIIWYGGARALGGTISVGVLVAFVQYAQRFFQPIQDLSEKYNIFQSAMASAERIFSLLDEPVEVRDPPSPKTLGQVRGEVEFRDVWFAYNHGEWVLRGVSFHVSPGESVAIVGHTGAGKTSIINLLCRFYDPQRGQIFLDGMDVRELGQQDLRRHLGVVLQDVFLFSGTVASNIRLGNEEITDEMVRRAAELANAHWFIESLPLGYDTDVKERGAILSVGQRQLIALARAIAHDPRVLLILDEATSSVDAETERAIQEALSRLMQGRTAILIAHRLATVQHVDRILVVHKGRIVEEGTHRQLLAMGGIYSRLYQLQASGGMVMTHG